MQKRGKKKKKTSYRILHLLNNYLLLDVKKLKAETLVASIGINLTQICVVSSVGEFQSIEMAKDGLLCFWTLKNP